MLESCTFRNHLTRLMTALVLLSSLLSFGVAREDNGPTARKTSTVNESVALTFLEARGNWDAKGLKATLADDLESYDIAATAEDYNDALAYYEAINWNWTAIGCKEDSSNTEQVACTAALENDWTRALSIGPFDMTFHFVVQDSKITVIDPQWNREFIENGLQPFLAFLRDDYPDDFELLYSSGQHFLPRGDEALDVLKLRTAAFADLQE